MISPLVAAEVRRLFFAEHWKVGTLAERFGLHHSTVSRIVGADRFASRGRAVPSRLDPYIPFIAETLQQHPRLTATRIHEMVVDRGYPGSVVQTRRLVKRLRPAKAKEAFFRLHVLPGEEGQVDWASFGKVRIGRAERPLSAFVMVLSVGSLTPITGCPVLATLFRKTDSGGAVSASATFTPGYS